MLPKSTSLDGGGRVVNFNIFILRNTYFILRVSESELLTYLKLNFSKFVINLYFSVRKSWPRMRARPPGTVNVSTRPSRRRSASYWLKKEEITPRWEGPEFETIKMNDYNKMLIKMLFTHVDGLTNQQIVFHHLKQPIFKV